MLRRNIPTAAPQILLQKEATIIAQRVMARLGLPDSSGEVEGPFANAPSIFAQVM
jgi:hypothetical protein